MRKHTDSIKIISVVVLLTFGFNSTIGSAGTFVFTSIPNEVSHHHARPVSAKETFTPADFAEFYRRAGYAGTDNSAALFQPQPPTVSTANQVPIATGDVQIRLPRRAELRNLETPKHNINGISRESLTKRSRAAPSASQLNMVAEGTVGPSSASAKPSARAELRRVDGVNVKVRLAKRGWREYLQQQSSIRRAWVIRQNFGKLLKDPDFIRAVLKDGRNTDSDIKKIELRVSYSGFKGHHRAAFKVDAEFEDKSGKFKKSYGLNIIPAQFSWPGPGLTPEILDKGLGIESRLARLYSENDFFRRHFSRALFFKGFRNVVSDQYAADVGFQDIYFQLRTWQEGETLERKIKREGYGKDAENLILKSVVVMLEAWYRFNGLGYDARSLDDILVTPGHDIFFVDAGFGNYVSMESPKPLLVNLRALWHWYPLLPPLMTREGQIKLIEAVEAQVEKGEGRQVLEKFRDALQLELEKEGGYTTPIDIDFPKFVESIDAFLTSEHETGKKQELRAEMRNYVNDADMGYRNQEIRINPTEVHVRLPAYVGRFLRHINPQHPLVRSLELNYREAIRQDELKGTRVSLAHEIPQKELAASKNYRELMERIKKTNAFKNDKIHFQEEETMHFTLVGGLEKRSREELIREINHVLDNQESIRILVKGPWASNFIRGRIFLRVYPEQDDQAGSNKISKIIRSMQGNDFKIYAIPLFQFKNDLTTEEAQEIESIYDEFRDKVIFDYTVDNLSLLAFQDDLLGGKEVITSIPLRAELRESAGLLERRNSMFVVRNLAGKRRESGFYDRYVSLDFMKFFNHGFQLTKSALNIFQPFAKRAELRTQIFENNRPLSVLGIVWAGPWNFGHGARNLARQTPTVKLFSPFSIENLIFSKYSFDASREEMRNIREENPFPGQWIPKLKGLSREQERIVEWTLMHLDPQRHPIVPERDISVETTPYVRLALYAFGGLITMLSLITMTAVTQAKNLSDIPLPPQILSFLLTRDGLGALGLAAQLPIYAIGIDGLFFKNWGKVIVLDPKKSKQAFYKSLTGQIRKTLRKRREPVPNFPEKVDLTAQPVRSEMRLIPAESTTAPASRAFRASSELPLPRPEARTALSRDANRARGELRSGTEEKLKRALAGIQTKGFQAMLASQPGLLTAMLALPPPNAQSVLKFFRGKLNLNGPVAATIARAIAEVRESEMTLNPAHPNFDIEKWYWKIYRPAIVQAAEKLGNSEYSVSDFREAANRLIQPVQPGFDAGRYLPEETSSQLSNLTFFAVEVSRQVFLPRGLLVETSPLDSKVLVGRIVTTYMMTTPAGRRIPVYIARLKNEAGADSNFSGLAHADYVVIPESAETYIQKTNVPFYRQAALKPIHHINLTGSELYQWLASAVGIQFFGTGNDQEIMQRARAEVLAEEFSHSDADAFAAAFMGYAPNTHLEEDTIIRTEAILKPQGYLAATMINAQGDIPFLHRFAILTYEAEAKLNALRRSPSPIYTLLEVIRYILTTPLSRIGMDDHDPYYQSTFGIVAHLLGEELFGLSDSATDEDSRREWPAFILEEIKKLNLLHPDFTELNRKIQAAAARVYDREFWTLEERAELLRDRASATSSPTMASAAPRSIVGRNEFREQIEIPTPDGEPIVVELPKEMAEGLKKFTMLDLADEQAAEKIRELIKKEAKEEGFGRNIFKKSENQELIFWALEHFSDPALEFTRQELETLSSHLLALPYMLSQISPFKPAGKNQDFLEAWWYLFLRLAVIEERLSEEKIPEDDFRKQLHLTLIHDWLGFIVRGLHTTNQIVGLTDDNISDYFERRSFQFLKENEKKTFHQFLQKTLMSIIDQAETWLSNGTERQAQSLLTLLKVPDDYSEVADSAKVVGEQEAAQKIHHELTLLREALTPKTPDEISAWEDPISYIRQAAEGKELVFLKPFTVYDQDEEDSELDAYDWFQLDWLREMSRDGFKLWVVDDLFTRLSRMLTWLHLQNDERNILDLARQLKEYLDAPLTARGEAPSIEGFLHLPSGARNGEMVRGLRFWQELRKRQDESGAKTELFVGSMSPHEGELKKWLTETKGTKRLVLGFIPEKANPADFGPFLALYHMPSRREYSDEKLSLYEAVPHVTDQIARTIGWGGPHDTVAIPFADRIELVTLFQDGELKEHREEFDRYAADGRAFVITKSRDDGGDHESTETPDLGGSVTPDQSPRVVVRRELRANTAVMFGKLAQDWETVSGDLKSDFREETDLLKRIVNSDLPNLNTAQAIKLWTLQEAYSHFYFGKTSEKPRDWMPDGAQKITLPGYKGNVVAGWMKRAKGEAGKQHPTIVMMSPWGLDAGWSVNVHISEYLQGKLPVNVVVLDHHAYAGKEDAYNTTGIVEARDVEIAVDALKARDDVDGTKVMALGHSLGAIVFALAQARKPTFERIIAVGMPATSREAVRNFFKTPAYQTKWQTFFSMFQIHQTPHNLTQLEESFERASSELVRATLKAYGLDSIAKDPFSKPIEALAKINVPFFLTMEDDDAILDANQRARFTDLIPSLAQQGKPIHYEIYHGTHNGILSGLESAEFLEDAWKFISEGVGQVMPIKPYQIDWKEDVWTPITAAHARVRNIKLDAYKQMIMDRVNQIVESSDPKWHGGKTEFFLFEGTNRPFRYKIQRDGRNLIRVIFFPDRGGNPGAPVARRIPIQKLSRPELRLSQTDSGRSAHAAPRSELRDMTRNVLVTGGAGYIGGFVLRELVSQGYQVTALDNLSRGDADFIPAGVTLVNTDLNDKESLRGLFAGHRFQAVVHLAGLTDPRESLDHPVEYFNQNLTTTLNLLQAMDEAKVHKIVFMSTSGVYASSDQPLTETSPVGPTHPYGETKLLGEKILEAYAAERGIRAVTLRVSNAIGVSRDRQVGQTAKTGFRLIPILFYSALKQHPFTLYTGLADDPKSSAIRDFVHTEDLAQAARYSLQFLDEFNGFQVLNVGQGRGHSIADIIRVVETISSKKIPLAIDHNPTRMGQPQLVLDISRISDLFGWMPMHVGLDGILHAAWAWHLNHPGKVNRIYRGSILKTSGRDIDQLVAVLAADPVLSGKLKQEILMRLLLDIIDRKLLFGLSVASKARELLHQGLSADRVVEIVREDLGHAVRSIDDAGADQLYAALYARAEFREFEKAWKLSINGKQRPGVIPSRSGFNQLGAVMRYLGIWEERLDRVKSTVDGVSLSNKSLAKVRILRNADLWFLPPEIGNHPAFVVPAADREIDPERHTIELDSSLASQPKLVLPAHRITLGKTIDGRVIYATNQPSGSIRRFALDIPKREGTGWSTETVKVISSSEGDFETPTLVVLDKQPIGVVSWSQFEGIEFRSLESAGITNQDLRALIQPTESQTAAPESRRAELRSRQSAAFENLADALGEYIDFIQGSRRGGKFSSKEMRAVADLNYGAYRETVEVARVTLINGQVAHPESFAKKIVEGIENALPYTIQPNEQFSFVYKHHALRIRMESGPDARAELRIAGRPNAASVESATPPSSKLRLFAGGQSRKKLWQMVFWASLVGFLAACIPVVMVAPESTGEVPEEQLYLFDGNLVLGMPEDIPKAPRLFYERPGIRIPILDNYEDPNLHFTDAEIGEIFQILDLIPDEHLKSIPWIAARASHFYPGVEGQMVAGGIIAYVFSGGETASRQILFESDKGLDETEKWRAPEKVVFKNLALGLAHEIGHWIHLQSGLLDKFMWFEWRALNEKAFNDPKAASRAWNFVENWWFLPPERYLGYFQGLGLSFIPDGIPYGSKNRFEDFATVYANWVAHSDVFLREAIRRAENGFPSILEKLLFQLPLFVHDGQLDFFYQSDSSQRTEKEKLGFVITRNGFRFGDFSFEINNDRIVAVSYFEETVAGVQTKRSGFSEPVPLPSTFGRIVAASRPELRIIPRYENSIWYNHVSAETGTGADKSVLIRNPSPYQYLRNYLSKILSSWVFLQRGELRQDNQKTDRVRETLEKAVQTADRRIQDAMDKIESIEKNRRRYTTYERIRVFGRATSELESAYKLLYRAQEQLRFYLKGWPVWLVDHLRYLRRSFIASSAVTVALFLLLYLKYDKETFFNFWNRPLEAGAVLFAVSYAMWWKHDPLTRFDKPDSRSEFRTFQQQADRQEFSRREFSEVMEYLDSSDPNQITQTLEQLIRMADAVSAPLVPRAVPAEIGRALGRGIVTYFDAPGFNEFHIPLLVQLHRILLGHMTVALVGALQSDQKRPLVLKILEGGVKNHSTIARSVRGSDVFRERAGILLRQRGPDEGAVKRVVSAAGFDVDQVRRAELRSAGQEDGKRKRGEREPLEALLDYLRANKRTLGVNPAEFIAGRTFGQPLQSLINYLRERRHESPKRPELRERISGARGDGDDERGLQNTDKLRPDQLPQQLRQSQLTSRPFIDSSGQDVRTTPRKIIPQLQSQAQSLLTSETVEKTQTQARPRRLFLPYPSATSRGILGDHLRAAQTSSSPTMGHPNEILTKSQELFNHTSINQLPPNRENWAISLTNITLRKDYFPPDVTTEFQREFEKGIENTVLANAETLSKLKVSESINAWAFGLPVRLTKKTNPSADGVFQVGFVVFETLAQVIIEGEIRVAKVKLPAKNLPAEVVQAASTLSSLDAIPRPILDKLARLMRVPKDTNASAASINRHMELKQAVDDAFNLDPFSDDTGLAISSFLISGETNPKPLAQILHDVAAASPRRIVILDAGDLDGFLIVQANIGLDDDHKIIIARDVDHAKSIFRDLKINRVQVVLAESERDFRLERRYRALGEVHYARNLDHVFDIAGLERELLTEFRAELRTAHAA